MKVAVLCVGNKSQYHGMTDVEVYDQARNALTFKGGMPVVTHPPCRAWSIHCSHQAKPDPGEKKLGIWCVDQVKKWGGVVEQPAHSKLWDATGLPRPSWTHNADSWSLEVWQAWWGYPMKKATWLYFSKINPLFVVYPLRLHARGQDRRREQLMSHKQRSETTKEFAEWLVKMARYVNKPATDWT